jgi:hypothetical protein
MNLSNITQVKAMLVEVMLGFGTADSKQVLCRVILFNILSLALLRSLCSSHKVVKANTATVVVVAFFAAKYAFVNDPLGLAWKNAPTHRQT